MAKKGYYDIEAEAAKITDSDIRACLSFPDFPFRWNPPRSFLKDKSYIQINLTIRKAENEWMKSRGPAVEGPGLGVAGSATSAPVQALPAGKSCDVLVSSG